MAVAALFALTGAVAGGAWALLVKRYAYEYLLIVKHVAYDAIWLETGSVAGKLAWEGMKFGLFAGTMLLALRTLRADRLPTWSEVRWDWVGGVEKEIRNLGN